MSHPKPPLESSERLAGRQIGDFLVLRMLGQGAMAEVYLAEQMSLRRHVALKVLKRELASDAIYVQRFHREAQAAASLVHPGIVQIHEVNCLDGVHYIAQEYVPGQNLRDYMARRGPPDLRLVLRVIRHTAAALAKAADAGIVHRDIKPENIMLAADGQVKVADFGLARLTSEANSLNLTQIGVTMGTPLYMSPEQVEGKPLDPRSDIYSLGVTCYHMLAGHPPFRGDTALSVAVQHLKQPPQRLEELRPDLPPPLCRSVHKMLSKDPEQRYAHPREVLKDLRELQLPDDDPHDHHLGLFADSDGETLAGRVQATQQLAAVMRTQALQTRRRRLPISWLLAPVAALMLGGLLAAATRPQFLLSEVNPRETGVAKQDSALAQFNYARWINPSEEAWQAVPKYFPDDPTYGLMAKKELAWLYLMRKDHEQAQEIFTEFANMDELDRNNRAFGLGGQAVLLHLEGDQERSAQKLGELFKLGQGERPDAIIRLFQGPDQIEADRQMLDMLRRVVQRNHAVNADLRAQWQETLAEEFAAEADPAGS